MSAGEYARAVLDILTAEFPHLPASRQADLLYSEVRAHVHTGQPLQLTIPGYPNWKLTWSRDDPRRVAVVCWKVHPADVDLQRAERVNTALGVLDIGEED